jgi:hypothetical protein
MSKFISHLHIINFFSVTIKHFFSFQVFHLFLLRSWNQNHIQYTDIHKKTRDFKTTKANVDFV